MFMQKLGGGVGGVGANKVGDVQAANKHRHRGFSLRNPSFLPSHSLREKPGGRG